MSDTAIRAGAPAAMTPRVVSPLRAYLLVVEGHWTWYRRNWKATLVSSVGMPILYLLAMGLGFGSQVHASAATGGLPYLVYLAPALLATSAMQGAAGEATYPVLSGFKWQKNFIGVAATPITPAQIVGGQAIWMTFRLLVSGAIFLAVAAAIGAVTGFGVVLSLLFGVLSGLAFGMPVVAWSASLKGDGNAFNPLFRFVVVPMSLFAGAFFPVSQLPAIVRPIAWITPVWHGTELARAAAFGTLQLWPTIGHLAYLFALTAIGVLLSRWQFRVRLAS
ncbi:MAG TPA: ABC transporter permease [Pseudonocardiaceae bacterium]|jgi:lipooligosaccharide transport system permease protein|nr:ABC transporter permease [Pseudonocardiaceae bacterium]